MKHNILLKSFFILMLIISLSSYANASEVTGTLSSSSTGNENSISGSISGTVSSSSSEVNGTLDNGIIAGNVSDSSSSSSGSSRRNTGVVLGASTVAYNPTPINPSYDSTAKNTTSTQPGGLAVDYEITDPSPLVLGTEISPDLPSTQIALAMGTLSGMNWFWIILLILLLIGTILYIYNRNKKEDGQARLH